MRWLIVLCLILSLSACAATDGTPLRDDTIQRVHIGETTQTQVRDLLGEPMNIRRIEDTESASIIWRYQHVQQGRYDLMTPLIGDGLNRPAVTTTVEISFDHAGIVQKVDRSETVVRSPAEGAILVP